MIANPRQIALDALRLVFKRGAYADIALDRVLRQNTGIDMRDRRLLTELVYGVTRRQRTLDALIDKFARKPAQKQPLDLRLILQLGLYQLGFLDQIPLSAAVDTSVELARQNKLAGLTGFVNAVLRKASDACLHNALFQGIEDIATLHSFPDWLVQLWLDEFGREATEKLCAWFNQSPHIDLRVNFLRTDRSAVLETFTKAEIAAYALPHIPSALRLQQGAGAIAQLPGFDLGWWTVQDASAQLAAYLLDPQPHEVVIDACAAPGGKTTHIAELMQDMGTIWACDRSESRLKKVRQNCDRLGLKSIKLRVGDSREFSDFADRADRVLLDVPCSGLGTLHRHADARWRQDEGEPEKLAVLQADLLEQATKWVKPGGTLVYTTCTLHPLENESAIEQFLSRHADWQLATVPPSNPASHFCTARNWIKVLPHERDMDGFFMAKLVRC